jgi:hypothetical protein
MPRKEQVADRIAFRAPHRLCVYLDELAAFGLHGDTRSEVARVLLTNEIERLIREGFLKLGPGPDARKTGSQQPSNCNEVENGNRH